MNVSTYLSKEELSDFKTIAQNNYMSKSALIRKSINDLKKDIKITKTKNTTQKDNISFSITNSDHLKLKAKAEQANISSSSYLYSIVLDLINRDFKNTIKA